MASSGESGEEESEVQVTDERKGKISEYEKQRISRIAENKARLEALGIPKAATAVLGSSPSSSRKLRGKRNSGEEDDDYRPGEADGDDEEEIDDESESECDDEDEDFVGDSVSDSSKSKGKASASKRKVSSKKNLRISEEDSDDDLNKAIALSLQDSPAAGGSGAGSSKKRRSDEEAGGKWKKKKPELTSRMQMTEDELVIYFYQFDGNIS